MLEIVFLEIKSKHLAIDCLQCGFTHKHCDDRGRLAAPRGVIESVCSNQPPDSRRSQFGAVFSDFTLVKPAKPDIMAAVCC